MLLYKCWMWIKHLKTWWYVNVEFTTCFHCLCMTYKIYNVTFVKYNIYYKQPGAGVKFSCPLCNITQLIYIQRGLRDSNCCSGVNISGFCDVGCAVKPYTHVWSVKPAVKLCVHSSSLWYLLLFQQETLFWAMNTFGTFPLYVRPA